MSKYGSNSKELYAKVQGNIYVINFSPIFDNRASETRCYARYKELDSNQFLQYCSFGTCLIDLWVAASEAASEVWLFFLYAWRKAGTEQFRTWQAGMVCTVRESRSEPAEALGLAVVMLGIAGFGEGRVKFCRPCFVR